jgi:dTMP kinase
VDPKKLAGTLIVVEGADGSGRSTQISRLGEWLEGCGYATTQVGLKRSTLVSEELDRAQQGNVLSRITLSLFYATDFADQLRISSCRLEGGIVLADRYIYTLMARDMVGAWKRMVAQPLWNCAGAGRCLHQRHARGLVQRTFAKTPRWTLGERHLGCATCSTAFSAIDLRARCVQTHAVDLRVQDGDGNRSVGYQRRAANRNCSRAAASVRTNGRFRRTRLTLNTVVKI